MRRVGALVVAILLSGCAAHERAEVSSNANPDTNRNVSVTTTSDPWAVTPYLPVYHPRNVVLHAAVPTRVVVHSIGVDAPLVPLGLLADGTMEVPADFATAGWYTGGPRPGETGPAVIAAHVDSRTGPAVFYRLKDVRAGDEIDVERADGSHAVFRVTRVAQFSKKKFPTDAVFGAADAPELRLVTCGGDFDFTKHSYRANVVVFASVA